MNKTLTSYTMQYTRMRDFCYLSNTSNTWGSFVRVPRIISLINHQVPGENKRIH